MHQAMFKGKLFGILPNIKLNRCRIIADLIKQHEGQILNEKKTWTSEKVPRDTILLINDDYLNKNGMLKNRKIFELELEYPKEYWADCQLLRLSWVSSCILQNQLISKDKFFVDMGDYKTFKRKRKTSSPTSEPPLKKTSTCVSQDTLQINTRSSDALLLLAERAMLQGEQFRCRAYQQASASLLESKIPIKSFEEAKKLPNVGPRIAHKIAGFVSNHGLEFQTHLLGLSDSEKLRKYFITCHQVGPALAREWEIKGFNSFHNVLNSTHFWNLSWTILYGMKYYEDWQVPISREEATKHYDFIQKHAPEGFIIEPMGSYRRGSMKCSDVDCIAYKENCNDIDLLSEYTHELIENLAAVDYITCPLQLTKRLMKIFGADLDKLFTQCNVSYRRKPYDKNILKKFYCGVRLPDTIDSTANIILPLKDEDRYLASTNKIPSRRLDILICKWDEVGAHRVHFTGNGALNALMRKQAKDKGMHLNQHGLFDLATSRCIESFDEYKILDYLGVPRLLPHERDRATST